MHLYDLSLAVHFIFLHWKIRNEIMNDFGEAQEWFHCHKFCFLWVEKIYVVVTGFLNQEHN